MRVSEVKQLCTALIRDSEKKTNKQELDLFLTDFSLIAPEKLGINLYCV